jgi:hypothetical protein
MLHVVGQGMLIQQLCALQLEKEQRTGGGIISRFTGSVQSWMMSFIQAHGFGGILLLVRPLLHAPLQRHPACCDAS